MATPKPTLKRRLVLGTSLPEGDSRKQGWLCQLSCGHETVATGRRWRRPKTAQCPHC